MHALCLLGRTDGRMWLVRLFGFEHRPSREARAHTGSACFTSFLYLSDLRTVALHRAGLRLASPICFFGGCGICGSVVRTVSFWVSLTLEELCIAGPSSRVFLIPIISLEDPGVRR